MTTVLITGANRGIGLELATIYARRGDSVIATVRDPAKAGDLRSLGALVEVVALDVAREPDFARASKALAGRQIDILIANAAKGKIAILSSRMGSSAAAAGTSYLYRASKAAAANIGANLAVELKASGVSVASYHPGWVQTDMGGASADIPAAVSAAGLVARIEHLSLATTGAFETYSGEKLVY
jgi:short-subunit dehydrogenase